MTELEHHYFATPNDIMVPGKKHGWLFGREGQTLSAPLVEIQAVKSSAKRNKHLNLAQTSPDQCTNLQEI